MDKKLLSISEVARILGVSLDTLRRWDKSGQLPSFRPVPTSNRYYRKQDIELFVQDISALARQWTQGDTATSLDEKFYSKTSDVFHARLQRMNKEMAEKILPENIRYLVVAIAGKIGNNSFSHNIGNWPDTAGVFFGYDLGRRKIVLADRGQGILTTLKRVRPRLSNDQTALRLAFSEFISGRAPESRGNGLKFVKKVVTENQIDLVFQTGVAELKLQKGDIDLNITTSDQPFRGCLAIINF